MNSIKTLIVLIILALLVSMNACETTPKSQSGSSAQTYGVKGGISRGGDSSGVPWDAYWAP
jgi:hypothetical protein